MLKKAITQAHMDGVLKCLRRTYEDGRCDHCRETITGVEYDDQPFPSGNFFVTVLPCKCLLQLYAPDVFCKAPCPRCGEMIHDFPEARFVADTPPIGRRAAYEGDGSAVQAKPMEYKASPCGCWVSALVAGAVVRGEDLREAPPLPKCSTCDSSQDVEKSRKHPPSNEQAYWCACCREYFLGPWVPDRVEREKTNKELKRTAGRPRRKLRIPKT